MPSPLDAALVFLGVGLIVILAAVIAGNCLAGLTGILLVLHASYVIWKANPRPEDAA